MNGGFDPLRQIAGILLLIVAGAMFLFYLFQSVQLTDDYLSEERASVRERQLPLRFGILVGTSVFVATIGLILLDLRLRPLFRSGIFISLVAATLAWGNLRLRMATAEWITDHPSAANRMVLVILAALVAAALAFALSYALAVRYSEGHFVRWESLGVPPGNGPVEFTDVRFDRYSEAAIFAAGSDGSELLRGSLADCRLGRCWEVASSIPAVDNQNRLSISPQCRTDYPRMSDPPGQIVSCASYSDVAAGSHLVREAHFVLLEGDSVWVWQFIPGMGMMAILMAGCLFALLVGLTLGGALFWKVHTSATRSVGGSSG